MGIELNVPIENNLPYYYLLQLYMIDKMDKYKKLKNLQLISNEFPMNFQGLKSVSIQRVSTQVTQPFPVYAWDNKLCGLPVVIHADVYLYYIVS